MAKKDITMDSILKERIPQWRLHPEKYFGAADIDAFESYFGGFVESLENFCGVISRKLSPGLGLWDYELTTGYRIGSGSLGIYLKDKHNGDAAEAFYEYLDHLEIYFNQYRETHQTISVFKQTYSTGSFRRSVSRWLRNNPLLGSKHLVLRGGNYGVVAPYMYVHKYHGFAIKCRLDDKNKHEAFLINRTEAILKEIGLSV